MNIPKIKGLYDNLDLNEDNTIINFPLFDFDKERKQKNKKDNDVNQLMQYYLLLAYYLEEAKKDESSLNYLLKKIEIKNIIENKENNDNNNGDDGNTEKKININELIMRLYQLAYKNGDKNHRDYPYYLYYNFIVNIDSEELQSFNELLNVLDENDKLAEIYRKVIIEKKQKELKKVQKEEMISYRNNTIDNIIRTNTNTKIKNNNNNNENILRKSNIDLIKRNTKINIFSLLHKRQSIQTHKLHFDLDENSEDFNTNIQYLINKKPEFESENNNDNISLTIINEIGELLTKDFPTESDLNKKNILDILEETHNKVIENKSLIKLVGQLKYLKLDLINTKEKCLAFWLNCFNYLILFTIFYRKWYIDGEKKWKKFFTNVRFDIGGKYFSFNDMQYIIFKKPTFFSSTYKPSDDMKKLNIEKINGNEKFNDNIKIIPFIIFLPIKKFLSPSLYNEGNIEKEINIRITNYIDKYIYIDDKKHLCCSELLLKYDSNIFGKGLKKYESFFTSDKYNFIKDKKYKKINSQKISWDLNLNYLIEKKNNDDK